MHLYAFVLGFAALASAAVFNNQQDVPSSGLAWKGPIVAGGPDVFITGPTLEDIEAQILELNPSYVGFEEPETAPVSQRKRGLQKRDWITCNPAGDHIIRPEFSCVEPIGTLMRMQGQVRAPPGWGGCTLVTCAHFCGVSLCNDNPFEIYIPASNILGDWVAIKNQCQSEVTPGVGKLKGQVFRDQYPKWNVVVKQHSC